MKPKKVKLCAFWWAENGLFCSFVAIQSRKKNVEKRIKTAKFYRRIRFLPKSTYIYTKVWQLQKKPFLYLDLIYFHFFWSNWILKPQKIQLCALIRRKWFLLYFCGHSEQKKKCWKKNQNRQILQKNSFPASKSTYIHRKKLGKCRNIQRSNTIMGAKLWPMELNIKIYFLRNKNNLFFHMGAKMKKAFSFFSFLSFFLGG